MKRHNFDESINNEKKLNFSKKLIHDCNRKLKKTKHVDKKHHFIIICDGESNNNSHNQSIKKIFLHRIERAKLFNIINNEKNESI